MNIIVLNFEVTGIESPVKIIDDNTVLKLQSGTVIIDLLAQSKGSGSSGNCSLTKTGETYTDVNSGVIIIADNLVQKYSKHSSNSYSDNFYNFIYECCVDYNNPTSKLLLNYS